MKNKDYNIIVGQSLKKLREIKGMSQADIGAIINVGKNTISQYENAKRKIKINDLCEIADEFNVPLDWFTGRNNEIDKKLKGEKD